jgi:hypothetical protein
MTQLEKEKVLDSGAQQKEMNLVKDFTKKSNIAIYRKKRNSIDKGDSGRKHMTRNIR